MVLSPKRLSSRLSDIFFSILRQAGRRLDFDQEIRECQGLHANECVGRRLSPIIEFGNLATNRRKVLRAVIDDIGPYPGNVGRDRTRCSQHFP